MLYIVVACVALLVAQAVGVAAMHQIVAILCGIAAVAALDGVAYVWFMSSPRRVALLLEMLEDFEGRYTPPDTPDDDEDSYPEVEEDDRCGDPECPSCYPPEEEKTEEEPEPENGTSLGDERGQDVAEYAVLLAVVLSVVFVALHLIGANASNVFSDIGSKIQ
jgi:Flp pilus assembly pilin Flp